MNTKKHGWLRAIALNLAVFLAACGNTKSTTADATAGTDAAADVAAPITWDDKPDCDPTQPKYCSLPWPSSQFLVPDATTTTGFHLQFGATTLPMNAGSKYIDGTAWQRMDGYSVAGAILLYFQNVDVSALPMEGDVTPSLADDAAIRLWSVEGGKWTRVPYWVELDSAEDVVANKVMNIRPAVILDAGTRYVVAVTGLKDTTGKAFAPSPAFQALLDGQTSGSNLGKRQAYFDSLFNDLKTQGLDKPALLLAWDFVTASDKAMHSDMLSMRDQGMQIVGDKGPELTVTDVEPVNDVDIAYDVTGTFHVPSFMDEHDLGTAKAYVMHRGPDGLPAQNGWADMPFWVRIPKDAVNGVPFGLNQYGHGLNGSGHQVHENCNSYIGQHSKLIPFACNMTGMAETDPPAEIQMILDFSEFPVLSDHVHQGMMEHLLLMRAMRERFDSLPEIVKLGVKVDKSRIYYTGESQGGIYGGTYMALSQDVTRGHLGAPGNSYSLLLQRSTDFEPFLLVVKGNYPDAGDRLIALSLIQILWDQVDSASYYVHLKQQPFPNTPAHDVLLTDSKGDFQVTPVSNEISVRSGFLKLMKNYPKVVPGLTETDYPYVGSGVVMYNFGNPWPTPGNHPPAGPVDSGQVCKTDSDCAALKWYSCDGATGTCRLGDPHDAPQNLTWRNDQLGHFLDTGEIIDVCGGDGCNPD